MSRKAATVPAVAVFVVSLLTLAVLLPGLPARAEGDEAPPPATDLRCALGEPAEDGTRWLAVAAVDPDGNLVPGEEGEVTVELRGGATFDGRVLRGLLIDGRGEETARVRLAAGAAQVLLAGAAGEDVAARVVLDGTPGEWVPAPAPSEAPGETASPVRFPSDGSSTASSTTYRLQAWWSREDDAPGVAHLHLLALAPDGKATTALDGYEAWIAFDDATVSTRAISGAGQLLDGRGRSWAVATPVDGHLDLEIGVAVDALPWMTLQWRTGSVLVVDRVPPPPAPAPTTEAAPRQPRSRDLPDPGEPGPSHSPFLLPFAVTDIVFDPGRPRAYATSTSGRLVAIIDTLSGRVERTWSFDLIPERLAISPDGSRLYATLLTRPHAAWGWQSKRDGYIGSWRLDDIALDRLFPIECDPFDIAAAPGDRLVVSPTGPGLEWLRVYDARDARLTGSAFGFDPYSWLTIGPRGREVYVSRSRRLERWDILPSGGVRFCRRSTATSWALDRTWASPVKHQLFTREGYVLRTSDDPATDMQPLRRFTLDRFSTIGMDSHDYVLATLECRDLRYFNLRSALPIRDVSLDSSPRFVGFSAGQVFLVHPEGHRTRLETLPHPAPGGTDNRPPSIHVDVTPDSPTTNDEVVLDASGSTDPEDPASALRFRWDVDGDGTWDTDWSHDPVLRHRFPVPGEYLVGAQVIDTYGLQSRKKVHLQVRFAPDPGEPAPDHEPFSLPFSTADAVFLPDRHALWISSSSADQVVLVDPEAGKMLRTWHLPFPPGRMSLDRDGRHLYVTMKAEDSDAWIHPERGGYILTWDLDSTTLIGMLHVPVEPWHLARPAPGFFVVSSTGEYHACLHVLSAEDGHELSRSCTLDGHAFLSLHPTEQRLYTGARLCATQRYDITDRGRLLYRGNSCGHAHCAARGGRMWFLDDHRMVEGMGRVVASTASIEDDMQRLAILDYREVKWASFDPQTDLLAVSTIGAISYYHGSTLDRLSRLEADTAVWFGIFPERLVALTTSWYFDRSRIFFLPHPAVGGHWDTPPRAHLDMRPAAPTNIDEIVLDASGTVDDESSLEDLVFRWDIDGDGTWDTPYSSEPTHRLRFLEPGPRTFRVEVRDPCGAIDTAEVVTEIRFVPDPGHEGPAHPPYEPSYALGRAVFDPARPRVFILVSMDHDVHEVDLETGLTRRSWHFERLPLHLALSPDGKRLYLTLRTDEEDRDLWSGRVVSWDLERDVLDLYTRLSLIPEQFIVTPEGFLLTERQRPGGGRTLVTLDPTTGENQGTCEVLGYATRFVPLPNRDRVYMTDSRGDRLWRFSLRPGGRIVQDGVYVFPRGEQPGEMAWSFPDGSILLGGWRSLYRVSDDPVDDLRFDGHLDRRPIRVLFDERHDEFFLCDPYDLYRYETPTLREIERIYFPEKCWYLGKHGKILSCLSHSFGETHIFQREINHPPVAEAGEDRVLECTGNLSATATLDGSGSWDPDSEGEPDQDIASWDWFEGETSLASGKVVDVPFSLGEHEVTLVVTDRSDATDDDSLRVTVEDTIAPAGSITWPPAGACFGPAALPVTIWDDVADTCDPAPSRTYVPGPGPSYTGHGDHDVTLLVTDVAGNEYQGHVPFTIDLVPPVIVVHSPDPGWVLGPGSVPASLAFTATDDDGAAGDVVHEWIEIEGCIAWDGNDYGDGDGLLSDEEIPLGPAELCRVVSTCGFDALHDPLVTIHAVDCGGNETAVSRRIPGSFTPLPGLCPP